MAKDKQEKEALMALLNAEKNIALGMGIATLGDGNMVIVEVLPADNR